MAPAALSPWPRMKMSRRRIIASLLALVVIVATSAGIYGRIRASANNGDPQDDDSPGQRPRTSASGSFNTDVAIPVKGVAAVRDTLVVSVTAAGQAEGWKKTVVVAQVSGRIANLPVRENDAVS